MSTLEHPETNEIRLERLERLLACLEIRGNDVRIAGPPDDVKNLIAELRKKK